MNQLIVIAIGGSFGAVLRFLVASGMAQWLGREFPYGTLTVNVVGSFLLGLLTEALIVQRIAIAADYRAAILVGFIGAFTTFSTFALDTVKLIEQDALAQAFINIFANVLVCVFAVALGLLLGRYLFMNNGGFLPWRGGVIPYGLLSVNVLVAFLTGLLTAILLQKTALTTEHSLTFLVVAIGLYLMLSGLYVLLALHDQGYQVVTQANLFLAVFAGNTVLCSLAIYLAFSLVKQM